MAVAVAPDVLMEALHLLQVSRPRPTDDALTRGERWDAIARVYAVAGRSGLIQIAQETGYYVDTFRHWIRYSQVFPPAWRVQYRHVSEDSLRGALHVVRWFSPEDPAHDLRYWLALADQHRWGRKGVMKAARARQQALSRATEPPSHAPKALAEGVLAWRALAAQPLSVADRGRLAAELARQLADAVAVFNQFWSPYYLERITLTRDPLI